MLVEGLSKNNSNVLVGRTRGYKIVHFKGNKNLIGNLVKVKIINHNSFTLEGILEDRWYILEQVTPMMKQYIDIKKEYKDCILMFRLGDFYEMFFDDALVAAKELESREIGRASCRERV